MKPEVRTALIEWFCGLMVGFTPLLAHALLHQIADKTTNWTDNWAADILIVGITTSGLSAVTIFLRSIRGALVLNGSSGVLITFTLLFFFSGMTYGVVAIGHAKDVTILPAIALLVGSTIVSLVFEISTVK
jgi:hypothetical protein